MRHFFLDIAFFINTNSIILYIYSFYLFYIEKNVEVKLKKKIKWKITGKDSCKLHSIISYF